MPAWDNLVVGGPILTENAFASGFEADFTKPLGGGIIGVQKGFDGDPFGDMTYPIDGQYKMGGHLQFHQRYATGYTPYEHVTDQRNNEQVAYRHPHTPGLDPNFLDTFDVSNGKLTLKARPTTQAERDSFARFKGYLIGPDGQSAKAGYLKAKFGTSTLNSWGAGDLSNDNAPVFFQNAPSDWLCPMISTYNRKSLSYGRSGIVFTAPAGARIVGDSNDLSNVQGWFPAFWPLEDVVAGTDINGRPHDLDTYTPGNPQAGPLLSELDGLEFFATFLLHITSHLYKDGNLSLGSVKTTGGRAHWEGRTVQYNTGQTLVLSRDTPIHVTVDRFPPFGTSPGVICYGINGVVMYLQEMPDYLGRPKIVYEPVGGDRPYLPYVDPNTALVKRLGTQTYAENGLPAYAHFCDIINISQIASFSRPSVRDAVLNNTAPSFRENETMVIDRHYMKPLGEDNPDSRAFIDYEAGEFGGSGPVIGPIDGGIVTSPTTQTTTAPFIDVKMRAVNGVAGSATVSLPEGASISSYTFSWSGGAGVNLFDPTDEYQVNFTLDDVADNQSAVRTLQCEIQSI